MIAENTPKEDERNPLSDLLKKVDIQIFGTVQEQSELLMASRDACSERGYHRISREPKSSEDLIICYDCELWFDKRFADSCGIKYIVEPQ